MPREENQKKIQVQNVARADSAKNYTQYLSSEIVADLQEAFDFYDKDRTGLIIIDHHFRNILQNFGFHRLTQGTVNADLMKIDSEFLKRTHVDIEFVKQAVAYRWVNKQGKEAEAAEAFKVFDKKDRNCVTFAEIKAVL